MSSLDSLRQKIDALDTELLRLLNERASLAKEIGVIKNRACLPIYSPDREMKLLRSLVERSQGPLRPEAIRAIYREIMSASLALEKDIAIACLGPSGSPAHQAALGRFGSSVRYRHGTTIAEVFAETANEHADCGVVPLEEPGHGYTASTLDSLADSPLHICAEIAPDPAGGARFIVLGRQLNRPSDSDRSMILLRIEDKAGALVSALEPFRKLGVNLVHFASRPAGETSDTLFFVEADGHREDLEKSGLLDDLAANCREVKLLGSYPKPRP
jgi:chorismate mutase / prephenate dehydratase